MSDEQSKQQVIEASREVIAAATLKELRGSYLDVLRKDASLPGAIRLNFDIPGLGTPKYFGDIA